MMLPLFWREKEAPPLNGTTTQAIFSPQTTKFGYRKKKAALDLRMCIAVISHMGIGGHRRIKPTLQTDQDVLQWDQMKSEVTAFSQSCIHCKQINGNTEP